MLTKAQEKDLQKNRKQIDIAKYLDSNNEVTSDIKVIKVENSIDFILTAKYNEKKIKKKLIFEFTKDNLSSDINLKLALDDNSNIEIEAVVLVPNNLKNCNSTLSMQALILDDKSRIHFTPSLEINNKNISADHHSTIGTPDSKQIEYLESRGINKKEAIQLIADSFLEQ